MICKKCGNEFEQIDDIELCHYCYCKVYKDKPKKKNGATNKVQNRGNKQ